MRNIICRLEGSDNFIMDFWCCNVNVKDDSQIAITVYNKKNEKQIDFDIPLEDIDGVIKYLEDCKEYLEDKQIKL